MWTEWTSSRSSTGAAVNILAVQCSPLEQSAAYLRGPAPRSQVRRT